MALDNLRKFEKDVRQCMKCGFCAYFCPVYRQEKVERSLSRGKTQLVRNALDHPGADLLALSEALDKCLLCMTCYQFCPAKTRVDRAVLAARGDLVAEEGLSLANRLAFRVLLPRRWLFGLAVRFASWFQWMLPGKGEFRHLPHFLTAMGAGRHVPSIPRKRLRSLLPEVTKPPQGVETRGRVAFFSGCAMEFVFPDKAVDLVRQLAQAGFEVVYKRGQGCCGTPVYMHGDFEGGRRFALANLELFKDFDTIVTGCATCSSGLREYGPWLARTDSEKKDFEQFAGKVKEFSKFLTENAKPVKRPVKAEYSGKKVTYHDPCHLCRHQDIRQEPRAYLKSLDGVEYVEMNDADRCCGLGGSFSIQFYDVSRKIADEKAENIVKSGADVVATACPGCIVQIRDALRRRGLETAVVHIAELADVDRAEQP